MNRSFINGYNRISKTAARKLYLEGKSIFLSPVNSCNLCEITPDVKDPFRSFDKDVNAFEFYNCNSSTSRYSAFYRKAN